MPPSPSHTDDVRGPSQRQLRVGEMVRHALVEIFLRGDVHDAAMPKEPLTVSEVRMSPDLRVAHAFVMPLGGINRDAVVATLNAISPKITTAVARRVNLKYAPTLRFRHDTTFDNVDRIEALLRNPAVQRDINSPTEKASHTGTLHEPSAE